MSEADSPLIVERAERPLPPDHVRWRLPKWIAFPCKVFVGMVLIQNLLGAVVVMGWVWRATQRFVLRAWWKRSRAVSWNEFVGGARETEIHRTWPNWFLGPAGSSSKMERLFGGFWLNLKTGGRAILNTWVITGPACALWIFSWYDGWNNSFNKGYEQAAVGPATGIAGVLLFIAAMFYLPMAQARHAATGDWRTFFQFRIVWKIIRKRWLESLGLAILFVSLSVPLTAMKTAPGFFTAMKADGTAGENGFRRMVGGGLEELPPAEALRRLKRYYLWCGLYVFGAVVVTRFAAARVYAGATLDCVQSGILAPDALHESEWKALHRLSLLEIRQPRERHWFLRTCAWIATRAGAITVGFAIALVWFGLVAQIYASEFLLKTDRGQGWWNQPLLQLPYFNYIPGRLESEAKGL
jgi:hypothetical protein